MKRWILISLLGLPLALASSTARLNAQHGHGGGLGPTGGGHDLGPSGAPGRADANDAGGGPARAHSGSSVAASTNPGGVLDHNSQLATKLETLLGISGPGSSAALSALKTDAGGFRNFGQFVAAAHVSHNLGIPFSELQAKMTGSNAVSLGKAIQELKPQANAKDESKKATTQTDNDLKDTSS